MAKSVPEIVRRIKGAIEGDLFLVLLIVLVGSASFGLGRLSTLQEGRVPVEIIQNEESRPAVVAEALGSGQPEDDTLPTAAAGQFVASKNSDKYHYPWCSGAVRIKEENKVWFQSKEEAERAGYTPAANCEGL